MRNALFLVLSFIGLVGVILRRDTISIEPLLLLTVLFAAIIGITATRLTYSAQQRLSDPERPFPMHPLACAACLFTALLGVAGVAGSIALRGVADEALHTSLMFASFACLITGGASLGAGLDRRGASGPGTALPAIAAMIPAVLLSLLGLAHLIFAKTPVTPDMTYTVLGVAGATLMMAASVSIVLTPTLPPAATLQGRWRQRRHQQG